ncbi:hypothetical protein MKW98_026260 [Papaver atlanticum]|uniref:Uncharacterized protein n=1 Tax=Papaver atlanticum TaxID=357466 RepID=A0AAD4SP27_9MAGN|nr:hypothetical protein MKW98_026260 [Papaver atlanticum]
MGMFTTILRIAKVRLVLRSIGASKLKLTGPNCTNQVSVLRWRVVVELIISMGILEGELEAVNLVEKRETKIQN